MCIRDRSPTLQGRVEATHSESLQSEDLRSSIGATFDKSFANWTLRGGARNITQRNSNESDSFTTAIVGAERRFQIGDRNASVNAEYEQDVSNIDRNRLSFGSRVQLLDHLHFNTQYERQSGIYDLSSFGQETTQSLVAGFESDIIDNTRLYSEYRMRGGIDGRSLATASGIRGNYTIQPGLTFSPAAELVNTISVSYTHLTLPTICSV